MFQQLEQIVPILELHEGELGKCNSNMANVLRVLQGNLPDATSWPFPVELSVGPSKRFVKVVVG